MTTSTPEHPTVSNSSRRLTADRVLAAILILLQLGILAYLSGARSFPVMMAVLTLWGLWTSLRLHIAPMPRSLLYAVMSIGFLLHYMFAPFPLPIDSPFIRSSLAHSLARLLISVQVLQLFLDHQHGRLPIWMAACGAVTLSFATNLRVGSAVHLNLLWIVAAFMGVFAIYGSQARRVVTDALPSGVIRWLVLAGALVLALGLGSGSSWALQKHERDIDWFLSEYLGYSGRSTRAGFSPSGRLESVTAWRADGAENVVLRIFADEEPGYLRGKVFDRYQGSSRQTSYTPWVSTSGRRPLSPAREDRNGPNLRPGDVLYEVSSFHGPTSRTLDIWPDEGPESGVFTPLGTQRVAVNDTDVRIDANGVISFADHGPSIPYMVVATSTANAAPDALSQPTDQIDHATMTDLDVSIDASVRLLAADLFVDCQTTQEKLSAVRNYFRANYQYQLGINVPHAMDPVTYFLTKRPAAHCEYFATGTAVLLRLAQVPCRYVVGYVAAEWNDIGGFWIARNKDAHAWVEAYDEEAEQWVIVESTPSAGVPQSRDPGMITQLADSFRHRLSILRMSLRQYGIMTFWSSLTRIVWSIPGLIFLMSVLVAMLMRYRPQTFAWPQRDRPPEHLAEMHRTLTRLDRKISQQGFERAPNETLTRFAERLRTSDGDDDWKSAAADCYDRYVDLRYRGETGWDAVQQMQAAMARIPAKIPREQSRQTAQTIEPP